MLRVTKGMCQGQARGLREGRTYLIQVHRDPIQTVILIPNVKLGRELVSALHTEMHESITIHLTCPWNFRAQFGHRNRPVLTVITDGLSPCYWY